MTSEAARPETLASFHLRRSLVQHFQQQIREQHHLSSDRWIAVVDLPVARRVLENTDGSLEQVHDRDLLPEVLTALGERDATIAATKQRAGARR